MELVNNFQAKNAANRLAALRRILSAMRRAEADHALEDEDRRSIRDAADDLQDEIAGTMAELDTALTVWAEIEDYGGPASPARDRAAHRAAAE